MNKEIERIEKKLATFNNIKNNSKFKKQLKASYDRLKDLPDDLEFYE